MELTDLSSIFSSQASIPGLMRPAKPNPGPDLIEGDLDCGSDREGD
jgi:hypothetical protein